MQTLTDTTTCADQLRGIGIPASTGNSPATAAHELHRWGHHDELPREEIPPREQTDDQGSARIQDPRIHGCEEGLRAPVGQI